MKVVVVIALLFCGSVADKERVDSNYADLLSDQLIQKIEKRLREWEVDEPDSKTTASSGKEETVTHTGKLTCHFTMEESKIIRTKESLDAGATYEVSPSVTSREQCRQECCKLGTKCNLAVYKDKAEGACYLFDCGTPNVCNFSSHPGYVSMHVTQWLDDQQQPVDQHENALEQLATEPETTTTAPVQVSEAQGPQGADQPQNKTLAPTNLRVMETTSSSVKLQWDSSAEVFSVHLKHLDGNADEGSWITMDHEYVVDSLKPHTNYTLSVMAYTHSGSTSASNKITVTTADDVPTKYPQASVKPVGTSLNVTWLSLSPTDARGLITQYKIVYKKHGEQSSKEVTVPGNTNEYLLNAVEPGMAYDVRVEAGTRAGFPNLGNDGWVTVTVQEETQGRSCSKFHFTCKTGSPRCIAIYDACDGVDHCSDGSDEKACSGNDDAGAQGADAGAGAQQEGAQQEGEQGEGPWNNNWPYFQGRPTNYQGPVNGQQAPVNRQRMPIHNQVPGNYGQLDQVNGRMSNPNRQNALQSKHATENAGQQDANQGGQGSDMDLSQQRPSYSQQTVPQQTYMQPEQSRHWQMQSQGDPAQADSRQSSRQQVPVRQQVPDQNILPDRQSDSVLSPQNPQQNVNAQVSPYRNGYSSSVQQPMQAPRRNPVPQFAQGLPQGPQHGRAQGPAQGSPQRQQVMQPDQQQYQNIPMNEYRSQNQQVQGLPQMPQLAPNGNRQREYNQPTANKPKVAQMPPQPAATLQKMQSSPGTSMGRDGVPVSELHDHSNTADHGPSSSPSSPLHAPNSQEVLSGGSGGKLQPSGKSKMPPSDQDSKTQINYSDGGTIYTHRKEGPSQESPKSSAVPPNGPSGYKQDPQGRPQNPNPNMDRSNYLGQYRQNLYPYGYQRGQANKGRDENYFNLSPNYGRHKTYTYPQYDNSLYNYIVPNNNDFDYDYNGLEAGHHGQAGQQGGNQVQGPRTSEAEKASVLERANILKDQQQPDVASASDLEVQRGRADGGPGGRGRFMPDQDYAGSRGGSMSESRRTRPLDPERSGAGAKPLRKLKVRPDAEQLADLDVDPLGKGHGSKPKDANSKTEDSTLKAAPLSSSEKPAEVSTSTTKSPEEPSTRKAAPVAEKKAADSDLELVIPGKLLKVNDEAKKTKLQNIRFNQTAILVLALGLSMTALLLIFAGCRLRTVKRRLRKGRPLNSNEADYLINGMYL